jgi:hypothetical protein
VDVAGVGRAGAVLFLVLLLACLARCISVAVDQAGTKFRRYVACREFVSGGKQTWDIGEVVGERTDESGRRLYRFYSPFWGRVIEVEKVNRLCAPLRDQCMTCNSGRERVSPHG